MADAVAARREARRRKILENSQSRLKIIAGKNSEKEAEGDTLEVARNDIPFPLPIDDLITPVVQSNGVIFTDLQIETPTHRLSEIPNSQINETNFNKPDLCLKLIAYKYDIVILSLVLQFVYYIFPYVLKNTLFFSLPTLYVIAKSYIFPSKQQTQLTAILSLLKGMSSTKVQKFLHIFQIAATFSQDICIYLFVTILVQSILSPKV